MSSIFTEAQFIAIETQAARTRDAIIANLLGRGRLRCDYLGYDPEVQQEIRDQWADLIEQQMRSLVSVIIDEMQKPATPIATDGTTARRPGSGPIPIVNPPDRLETEG